MDINNIRTPGEFYETAKREGYSIPVQVPHLVQLAMEHFDCDLPTAHQQLIEMQALILVGKTYIADLSAFSLFDNPNNHDV